MNLSAYVTSLVANVLAAAFEGAVQAFLWVTLVFAMLERTGVPEGSLPFKKKKWSVDDLPPAAERPGSKISRAEAVVGIIFNVIFISIFLFRPELFAWYMSGDNGPLLIVPVFDLSRLHTYLPAMVILAAVHFGLAIYKFITRRWILPLAAVNTFYN